MTGFSIPYRLWSLAVYAGIFIGPTSLLGNQPFDVGLFFLDSSFESEHQAFLNGEVPDQTFHPAPLTDPLNNAVMDGGLAGWTENEARRHVVMAVEDIYRAVEAGDPDTTLAIRFHQGPAPGSTEGRSLNVLLGSNEHAQTVLGLSIDGAAWNPSALPNGADAAVVLLDNLDTLQAGDLTTSERVFNNLAGTIAHEVAHWFDLEHVAASIQSPPPIMANGATGVVPADRLLARRFTGIADTQGLGASSESKLVSGIGTVSRFDFDMDGQVTILGDASAILANWQLGDALFQDGDANGDHFVNMDDASALLASLSQSQPAAVVPEPATIVWCALIGAWILTLRDHRVS